MTGGGLEKALALLGSLEEADRRWILEHLPDAAKARLVAGVGGRDGGSRLAEYEAARVAEVLSTEPAWLVHAVLSTGHGPWKAEVLQGLPATLRMEVNAVARHAVTLARPAIEFLLQSMLERLQTPPAATLQDVQFDSLVLKFTRGAGQ